MTTEVLSIETQVKDTPVKNLKTELREAQKAAAQLAIEGKESTAEYTQLLRRMALIRDTMEDVRAQAAGFHPDKFERIATVANGIAGGFSVAAGAMQLFGMNGESAEKAMAKLQAVMAVSQGIAQLKESIELFKMMGAQIKASTAYKLVDNATTKAAAAVQSLFAGSVNMTSTSFKVLKGAIAATGIGVLVLLLGEVVSMFQSMGDAAEEAAQKYERSMNFIKGVTELDTLDQRKRLAEMKKNGASEQEIMAEKVRGVNNQIDLINEARNKDLENAQKYDIEILKLKKEGDAMVAEFQAEQAEKARGAAKQAQAEAKQRSQQAAQEAKQQAAERARQAQELADKLQEIEREISLRKTAEMEKELLELDYWWQDQQAIIIKNGGDLLQLRELFLIKETEIRKTYADKEAKEKAEAQAKFTADFQQRTQTEFDKTIAEADIMYKLSLLNEKQYLDYKLQIHKDYAKDTRLVEKEITDQTKKEQEERRQSEYNISQARYGVASSFAQAMVNIGNLVMGESFKNTAGAKVLGLAQIAIDEAKALSAALFNSQASPDNIATGGISGLVKYAAIAGSITSAALRARNILKGGSSTGFSVSTPANLSLGTGGFGGGQATTGANNGYNPDRMVLVVDHYENGKRRARRNSSIGVTE